MNNSYFIGLLVLIFFSCSNQFRIEESNSYEIISLLYIELAKPIEEPLYPPPRSDGRSYTHEDTVRFLEKRDKNFEKREERTHIVSIHPSFLKAVPERLRITNKCENFHFLIDELRAFNNDIELDVHKIEAIRNDSIISYKKELTPTGRVSYASFDILLSFSRIAFNKDFTKAVVVGSSSTSTLSGVSILFFLEKSDNTWSVKCKKGLSIS